MGRALAFFILAITLSGFGLCHSAAQSFGRLRAPAAAAKQPRRLPLNAGQLQDFPLQRISKEAAVAWRDQVRRLASTPPSRGNGFRQQDVEPQPPATIPQYQDLTTVPRPPQVGASTVAKEIQPAWSWDQNSIFFASNNVDPFVAGSNNTFPVPNYGVTTPPSNARYHIYQMSSDGNFIAQITGTTTPGEATGNQLFPAISHAETKLAYVHRDSPADPYQLYVLDFFTGQRQQMTGDPKNPVVNNPLNTDIVSVEHPSWSPGDNLITFAARNRNVTGDVRNIYTIDVASRVVTKLTSGSPANGVECIDPVFHPDLFARNETRITFAANAGNPVNGSGVNPSSGDLNYVANPKQDLNGDKKVDEVDHNLFQISGAGFPITVPAVQLTFDIADDIEPAYQQSDYPPTPNGPAFGAYNNWLAFASKGRRPDPNTPVGRTYDIYFNNGSPETQSTPIRLFTPDTNAGAIPLNQTDERYPTWSAGLPPQNPVDQIAFQSNRVIRKNPDGTFTKPLVGAPDETDIWSAQVADITPPTLFPIEDAIDQLSPPGQKLEFLQGEVLHIANAPLPTRGRRVGAAGDTFYFYAKVQDLQYGVESLWAQIKDPDGPSTDSRGVNHKLFGVGSFPGPNTPFNNVYPVRFVNGGPTHYLHIPYETDFAGVGAVDYNYYQAPVRFDDAGFSNARFPTFNPGVDDSVRWSGNQNSLFNPVPTLNRPPLIDPNGDPDDPKNQLWLRLHDDGNFPDQKAGDDIYSASWTTPTDPSDFYVDLIAYDKAFNPSDPRQQGNWIIYDNIWGFSTQPFAARNPVLYVDDNGAGQKWPRGLKGNYRPFREFRYGTESDCTDRDPQFNPREWRGTLPTGAPPGGGLDVLYDVQDPGSFAGAERNETWHFLNGNSIPYDFINWQTGTLRAYRYDMWRILAKGPLPESTLNDYVPTTDTQPTDITGSKTVQRPVPVRAVVWNAPYTGDIFSGGGSILDQATQTLLTNYKNRAGRLFIAGGDILWALTVNGQVTNQAFVQNVLGADFRGDESYGNFNDFLNGPTGGPIGDAITHDKAAHNFNYNAITDPPYYYATFYDPEPLGTATSWPGFFTNPGVSSGNTGFTAATDGTPFRTQDAITARSGWEQIFQDRMVAQVSRVDPADPATESKTVFLSASLASVGRRYVARDDGSALDCMNYRAKISHAMFCWMFSAELTGQVTNLNGGRPVPGAWVQAYQGGVLVGSDFTDQNGNYEIRGLPVGGWELRVDNPGFFSFSKATSNGAHGLDQRREDFRLSPAPAGSISGKVTDKSGQPVPGVKIIATLQASPLYTGPRVFTGTTGNDGKYTIANLPAGTYVVTVDTASLPPGFSNPNPASYPNLVVTPAQDTPNTDFTLEGNPGTLTVKVFAQLPDGTKGAPVQGADVTLLDSTGAPIPGFTATTDRTGTAVFKNVPAGKITVSAFKFGFQEGTKTADIPQDSTVEILLAAAQKRDLYGLVVRKLDGKPLSGSDLTVPVVLQLLRGSSQIPTPLTATVLSRVQNTPGANPKPYNYLFQGAQEGQFIVALRNHPRFKDAQVTVDITSILPNVAPDLQVEGKDGILSGAVKEDVGNGRAGAALAGAQVTVVSKVNSPGQSVGTFTTGADGRWNTGATAIPSDIYTVTVKKFGFATKVVDDVFVAGDTDIGTVLLGRGPRGRIYGLARRAQDKTPRGGVKIEFFTASNSPFGQQKVTETTSFLPPTTGPDGQPMNYTAGATATTSEFLPEGVYDIKVNDPRFAAVTKRVTLTGGQSLRVDIDLQPLAGVLQGTVKEDQGRGVAGPAIRGATVKITRNGVTVATLTTDTAGHYQTPTALAPAQYVITASAFGYVENQATVFVEGATTAPDILLAKVPPSTVRGSVRSSLDRAFIGGAKVELLSSDGQTVVLSTTSNSQGSGNPATNFTLSGVQPGTYILRASKGGWKSAQRNVTINPGSNPANIDLQLDPDHVFGRGLLLISLPESFPNQDAAALFDQPSSTFKSAYWIPGNDPDSGRYAIYPERPAAEFTRGKGMFVRFPNPVAFTKTGTPTPNVPIPIPVQAGWNLIGNPRRERIEWLNVQVQVGNNKPIPMQEAAKQQIVRIELFGYTDGYFRSNFLEPFSGYFMKALQDCTLIVPVTNSSSSVTPETRGKMARMPAPSLAQVAAELAAAGLGPVPGRAAGGMPRGRVFTQPERKRMGSRSGPRLSRLFESRVEQWPWRRRPG
jgi:hypothetical protein